MTDEIFPANKNTPLPKNQDRDLDPSLVDQWCTGCPYKAIKDQSRNTPNVNGQTNPIQFNSVGENYASHRKARYVCTSPKQSYPQKMNQQHSTIGFGFCPYFEEKYALLYSRESDGD